MKKPALLVIDMQNALAEAHPYEFTTVLANVQTLLSAARMQGMEVIFVQHTEAAGTEFEIHSHGWELVKDLVPLPNEYQLTKNFNSAFRQTNLDRYLQTKHIQQLIIVGMQTEYCIDASIKVAFELGYEVIVPEKTNTTFDNALLSAKQLYEHYHFYVWNHAFAQVISLSETIQSMQKWHPIRPACD